MLLMDKIKELVDSCEIEGEVILGLKYNEISKIYSALKAMDTYTDTITDCLLKGLDKETLRMDNEAKLFKRKCRRWVL